MRTGKEWVGAIVEFHLQATETRLSRLDIEHHQFYWLVGSEGITASDERNERITDLPRSAGNQHLEWSLLAWASCAACLQINANLIKPTFSTIQLHENKCLLGDNYYHLWRTTFVSYNLK